MDLTDSAAADFSYTVGRYIIEVKLTNGAGDIAFRREVIEIWKNTSTAFIFAPAEYLDPNTAIVANSKARLSETDTKINGQAIGIGTGIGNSEQNPKTYTFSADNTGNVSITLVFETDSLFAAIAWAASTGAVPGVYSETALSAAIDFSTNNVFWIKAVSEDHGETVYYRFILMPPPVNYGAFKVSATNAAGVSYVNPDLTISQNGTYIISMRDGVSNTTLNKITVASGVTADITLSGVQIDVSGTSNYCAFDMTSATVNLTLAGENILKSAQRMAGLQAPAGSTLVITEASTGSLTATGGSGPELYGSAGIGGGSGAGGMITINGGTVTAIGGSSTSSSTINRYSGAGIGSGSGSNDGGTITINGGTVTATGGSYSAGIGGGDGNPGGTITINGGVVNTDKIGGGDGYYVGGAGGTLTITGGVVTVGNISSGYRYSYHNYDPSYITVNIQNAVVFASYIQPTLTEGTNVKDAIVFIGNTGTMYGNVTLDKDVIIPSDRKLVIKNGQTLVIESGYTLTNNGTIWLEGNVEGIIIGNPPVQPAFTVSGGSAYTYVTSSSYTERVLTITGDGTYTISMRNGVTSTTTDRIKMDPYVNANITLSGINIDVSSTSNTCAFDLSNATVHLTLAGTNILKSGSDRAGLQAPAGATLVIMAASTGSLEATGGSSGAGIGGGRNGAGGTITINGGMVTATGGSSSAGIGGGFSGTGGTITINGGTVTATGGDYGAGIGGGSSGAGGMITINGGTVTAASGSYGAGIGGGIEGAGGTITINGGTVTASGGSSGAGIGGGGVNITNHVAGAGGTITISGGTVTATGGRNAAGIGGGGSDSDYNGPGEGGTVTINGSTVTVFGGENAAGIGGGYRGGYYSEVGASGSIDISGNAVLFASSVQPTLTEGDNVNNALVFIKDTYYDEYAGTMYGNVTLNRNVTIPSAMKLNTGNGQTLIIETGYTLTNNGTIWVGGGGNIEGTVAGNPPIWPSFSISGDLAYTYMSNSAFTERVLTITGNGTYTIGMRNGIDSNTTDSIVVASGVNANITLTGVNIDVSTCAFDMSNATVNLTLIGANVFQSGRVGLRAPAGSTLEITAASTGSLEATGGYYSAGIGGGYVFGSGGGSYYRSEAGGTITINGGTIVATGGNYGAGIGGGGGSDYSDGGAGGMITINGGMIVAIGGYRGAGIGGGGNNSSSNSYTGGEGGTIIINGGTVTASSTGSNQGAGIGGGYRKESYGTINISGNAVVFARSIGPTFTEGDNVNNAIVFIGNTGRLYGNVTLAQNVTFDAEKVLTINSGKSLTIPGSVTLTNNGRINVVSGGTVTGTVTRNQPVYGGVYIVVDMYDSYSDGWNSNGALRISVNGADIPNVRLASGGFDTYTFLVTTGDVVNIYWTGNSGSGTYHYENAFIVYYDHTPPSPSFTPNSWSGSNSLLFKEYNSLSSSNIGQLLGSFTVP